MFFIVVCSYDVKQDKQGSPSVSTRRTLNRKEIITMAFTRDSLKQFGITDDEVITKILNAHLAELDSVRIS